MSVIYDAGPLIAAEHNERRVWAEHRVRLEMGIVPVTTAPVVAQVSRSPHQAQLRRFLRGCEVTGFAADQAHQVGALLGRADRSDIVDAHVVLTAAALNATVLTADRGDLAALAQHVAAPIRIQAV
jgi:hypothetical protein